MLLIVIKFERRGHKHYPVFDLNVFVNCKNGKQKLLRRIGLLNLNFKERFFFLDLYSLGYYMNKGANLNYKVRRYLSKFIFI